MCLILLSPIIDVRSIIVSYLSVSDRNSATWARLILFLKNFLFVLQ